MVAVFGTLTIASASQTQTLPITGRVISKTFYIKERTQWTNANTDWSYYYYWYSVLYRLYYAYFPLYMNSSSIGLKYVPLLTINPDTTSITYHWPTANAPLFLVNSTDGALRWEVIKWTECP